MLDNVKPNFYAILPAYVRYDNELSSTAKLLYAEITALCNERGYCWANNQYFMKLYDISERQLQKIFKQLKEKNYIKIEIQNNTKRKIFVSDNPVIFDGGEVKKSSGVPVKNFTHNIINSNISENIKKEKTEIFEYDWLNDRKK